MKYISKIGHAKELFVSSDPHALVEHIKKVLVIEDGEVVHIKVQVQRVFTLTNHHMLFRF